MSGQSPLEILQNGDPRVTLHHLGYGRVLVCASRDFDLSRNSAGISLTPFGVIFETNLVVNVQRGYSVLVASAAGSYVQLHANVVWGQNVPLILNIAMNGQTAMTPRVYRLQPLAVLSLMESQQRPDLPIQGPIMDLEDDGDDDDAGEGPSGAAAPPPSLLTTPARTPSPAPPTLVPETPTGAEARAAAVVSSTEESTVVPSSDPEEEAATSAAAASAVGSEESDGGLWTGGESEDSSQEEEDDNDAADTQDSDSEGGDDDDEDDEVVGGDPLQGSAGQMNVVHRSFLFVFTLTPGDDSVRFPPTRGYPIRRLLREVETQVSEDAKNVGWQSTVNCQTCPFDCIFIRFHWVRLGSEVRVTMALASHMFSNMADPEILETVRLVMEHRARVIFAGPVNVTAESL